jgi:hypothetical protein
MGRSTAKILGEIDEIPVVAAIRHGDSLYFRCPWCKRVHHHGLGGRSIEIPFGWADGHWIPHCITRPFPKEISKGYCLREVREKDQAGTIPVRIMRSAQT